MAGEAAERVMELAVQKATPERGENSVEPGAGGQAWAARMGPHGQGGAPTASQSLWPAEISTD